jgi:class 3 adenylate cyclase
LQSKSLALPDRPGEFPFFIKTSGDGLLAIFDGPARAVRCAQAIKDGVKGLGLTMRAGLHTARWSVAAKMSVGSQS